jgi:predicted nucleotidyltransferase
MACKEHEKSLAAASKENRKNKRPYKQESDTERIMAYNLKQLANHIRPVAEKYNIPAIYVFGSYARGNTSKESDVDLLIDTEGTDLNSSFQMGGLYNDISSVLPIDFDMITLKHLNSAQLERRLPDLVANVKKDMVKIYER